jgi:hypothetical protein
MIRATAPGAIRVYCSVIAFLSPAAVRPHALTKANPGGHHEERKLEQSTAAAGNTVGAAARQLPRV